MVVKAPAGEAAPVLTEFDRELAAVLRTRDVFRFRNFLAASGRALPAEMMLDTRKMETLLHQLTLTLPELADLHAQSRRWLEQNTLLGDRSLNESAQRAPGDDSTIPPPAAGRRVISLREIPPSNPSHPD